MSTTTVWQTSDASTLSEEQVMSVTMTNQLYPSAAQSRFESAEVGPYYVFGLVTPGAQVIQYDSDGIKTVDNRALLGEFETKAEAVSFQSKINNAISNGQTSVDAISESIDGVTSSVIDTLGIGMSDEDKSASMLSNSSMLSNFLTSNSPTLNVPMAIEEACNFITKFNSDKYKEISWDTVKSEAKALLKKLIARISEQLLIAISNYSLKLRRMAVAKIKEYANKYVASSCLSSVSSSLAKIANPKNPLSATEFCGSVESLFSETWNQISELYDQIVDALKTVYEVVSALFTPFSPESAKKLTEMATQMKNLAIEMLCARTKSMSKLVQQGIVSGLQDKISGAMNSCLFQQALKSTKDFAPDSLAADVLTKIDNLCKEGSLFDAYNVALAAGYDLRSSRFQIELPSANSWVSDIYGDPYLFTTESQMNGVQFAKMITSDLPTASEMTTGQISEDKMSNDYVSSNWSDTDTQLAASIDTVNDIVETNNQIIEASTMTEDTKPLSD